MRHRKQNLSGFFVSGFIFPSLALWLPVPSAAASQTTGPNASPQPSSSTVELFKSKALTEKGLFTKGIEGPTVNAAGDLFVVNFQKQGTIGKVQADGKVSLHLELPEGSVASGLRFGPKGELYVADYKAHTIYVVKAGESKPEIYVREPRMSQPNDLVVANDGMIWATDPNWKKKSGRIWRVSTDRKTEIAADSLGTINGIDLSPDEKALYVSDSNDRSIWSFPIKDGRLGPKRLIKRFPDASVDGLKTDVSGAIYVARIEKGAIVKLTPDGKVVRDIPLLGKNPTNLTFGGADGRTVFVTQMEGGFIETFHVDQPGREHK